MEGGRIICIYVFSLLSRSSNVWTARREAKDTKEELFDHDISYGTESCLDVVAADKGRTGK